eukprot:TRINITY_DN2120_c0_g3_i1.p1 TRINITY_DN2120_c0_g3~~TRINITY_DN2120_c0_g3_i1.p1  ORF type:complete len:672 (+),score=107.26 TRINITY_DN2120_c0_g3_i1:141-2156(+)
MVQVVVSQQGQQRMDPQGERQERASIAESIVRALKDGKVWEYIYYHPWARLLVSVGISSLNFLIYAEDPVAHSYAEAELPVIGHAYSLIFLQYPGGGKTALKVIFCIGFFIAGLIIGRLVVHHLVLRDLLKMEMFGFRRLDSDDERRSCYCPCKRNTPYNQFWWWKGDNFSTLYPDPASENQIREQNDDLAPYASRIVYQKDTETAVEVVCPSLCHPKKHREHTKGSWLVMFFSTIVVLFIGALIYNIMTSAEGDDEIDAGLECRNRVFMKVAACGTWLGDLFTAVMVFDGMLQEVGRHQRSLTDSRLIQLSWSDVKKVVNEFKLYRVTYLIRNTAPPEVVNEVVSVIATPARRLKLGYVTWWPSLSQRWDTKLTNGSSSWMTWRVVVTWLLFLTTTLVVMFGILLDFIKWDEWSEGLSASSETQRALLAAIITGLDLVIVMQDWEFPAFDTAQEVRFPGVNISELSCGDCCSISVQQKLADDDPRKSEPENVKLSCFTAFATGKWFNYGIIFCVMCLDFNMLKNQLVYEPGAFGQYLDHDRRVCTPRDYSLSNAIVADWIATKNPIYENGTFHDIRVREGHLFPNYNTTDFCMPSMYMGHSAAKKYSAAIPSFASVALFFFWLYKYNRLDRKIHEHEIGAAEGGQEMADAANIQNANPYDDKNKNTEGCS